MIKDAEPLYVTKEDLDWWLQKSEEVDWTWAKTYAEKAPHDYVVLGRTKGMTHEDFKRAAAVILTFGTPAKYYNSTNIYLTHGDKKWWIMPDVTRDLDYNCTLINRADVDQVYGTQNAPTTETEDFNLYDKVAAGYDSSWLSESDIAENEEVKRIITTHFGAHAPSMLDVGCGTGLLLDLGVTSPALYTGIDPSQGMLNELVLKHPNVSHLYPAKGEDILLGTDDLGQYELVASTFAAPSYMPPAALKNMVERATSLAILMCYPNDWLPDYYSDLGEEAPKTLLPALEALHEIAAENNTEVFKIGCFDTVVVRR